MPLFAADTCGSAAPAGDGIVARLPELVRCRPDRRLGGFAPGGKVATHLAGQNRSPFNGRGMEFDEARIYRPGDDVRAIDWRVTARTGTVHTKLFREERERPVLVLLDCRRSMHFGTRVRFKSVLAAQIAATLSWVALDGGDRIGGFVLGPKGLESHSSTRTRHGLLRWLHVVSEATGAHGRGIGGGTEGSDEGTQDAAGEPTLAQALRRLRQVCRPGTLVFVISDFADLGDAAEAELGRLARHACVSDILVHDRLEERLPERGDLRVSDGTDVIALAALRPAERRAHESDFQRRITRLEKLERHRGCTFLALATDADPASVLRPRGSAMARTARMAA